jgi:hypothetical protein
MVKDFVHRGLFPGLIVFDPATLAGLEALPGHGN